MPTTLTVRDESTGGGPLHEIAPEILRERIPRRELIPSPGYQEVQDYNLKQGQVFHGLVQPEEAEKALNGWKLKKPRLLDWQKQFERAIEAFEGNRVLILVNDRQAASLDEEFTIVPRTTVSFLR